MSKDEDNGFFLELERAAKGLSIGHDGSSAVELRRLFAQLQADGCQTIESVLPDCEILPVHEHG